MCSAGNCTRPEEVGVEDQPRPFVRGGNEMAVHPQRERWIVVTEVIG